MLVVGVSLAASSLAACSILTSFDGLPLDTPPDAAGAALDAREADAPVDAGTACPEGEYRCGGDGIVGDPSTLHRCLADGGAIVAIPCAKGCARRPGRSGACICVAGTKYCGNDQVVGDPGSIYECQSDYSGRLIRVCDAGCSVKANAQDECL